MRSPTAMGSLISEAEWIGHQKRTHGSIYHITESNNKESDAASQFTHFPVSHFLCHFKSYLPQPKPFQLRLLPYANNRQLCTILHTKRSPQYFPLPQSRRIALPVGNEKPSAHGCASPQTSPESRIQSLSSISFLGGCAQGSSQQTDRPFKSEAWSNTSAPWGKYLRQWGPNIQDSTPW